MRTLSSLVEGKERVFLALLVSFVASAAAVALYLHNPYSFLFFGDAASHIVKAREFTDSHGLWFHYLGTVWLPLPHLLLVPFVACNALFFSGIAAPLVGIPCLVGTCLLLNAIVLKVTGSHTASLLSACLFGLNPNVIYMALTPMNEPSLLFFVTLGGYAFLRWMESDSLRWMLAAGAAVMLASLCRYEAWPLVPYVIVAGAYETHAAPGPSAPWTWLRVLMLAAVSSAGLLFWGWWNLIEFGSPLAFAQGTYSVIPDAFRESPQGRIWHILFTFGRAILIVFGPILLLLSVYALRRLRGPGIHRRTVIMLVYFALPILFILASVLAGYVGIDEWWWNWRYVLTLGLFLALAGGIGLARLASWIRSPMARGIVVSGLLATPALQLSLPFIGVATYNDAAKCMLGPTPSAIAVGREIRELDAGGSIALLMAHGQAQRIMVSSWIPLSRFDVVPDPGESSGVDTLLASEQMIVIGAEQTPESAPDILYWNAQRGNLLRSFGICRQDPYFILLRRSPPPVMNDSAAAVSPWRR